MCAPRGDPRYEHALTGIIHEPCAEGFVKREQDAETTLQFIRASLDLTELYSVVMDISPAVWQESPYTQWIRHAEDVKEIYLLSYLIWLTDRPRCDIVVKLSISGENQANATRLLCTMSLAD